MRAFIRFFSGVSVRFRSQSVLYNELRCVFFWFGLFSCELVSHSGEPLQDNRLRPTDSGWMRIVMYITNTGTDIAYFAVMRTQLVRVLLIFFALFFFGGPYLRMGQGPGEGRTSCWMRIVVCIEHGHGACS